MQVCNYTQAYKLCKNNTMWLGQQKPTGVITIYSKEAESTFQKFKTLGALFSSFMGAG